MIKLKDIYKSTNDGLDIILHYYPTAKDSVKKPTTAFKIRDEETLASSYLKKIGDCWRVTDFGEELKAKTPIDICMREENISFREAITLLGQRYNVDGTYIKAEVNKAIKTFRPATPEEIATPFNFKCKDEFTEYELKVFGDKVEPKHMTACGYRSLEWMSITRKTEKGEYITITTESTDKYPIYLRTSLTDLDEEFYKVYQPFALPYKDKNGYYHDDKFAYYNVPAGFQIKSYVNGLNLLRKAYIDNDETKIDEVCICSGERDAVNMYAYGYIPLWLNCETAELDKNMYLQIVKFANKIYNIGDIDATGKKAAIALGLKYISIYNIKLPEKIREYNDNKGKPRKDLRDYLDLFPDKNKLENLFKVAMPYQFWEWKEKKKDQTGNWEVNIEYLLNFLVDSGFRKQRDGIDREFFVRIIDNVIKEVTPRDIRSYIFEFIKEHTSNIELRNLIRFSKKTTTAIFEDLPDFVSTFRDNNFDSQYFFFQNKVILVTAKTITEFLPKNSPLIYPEKMICNIPFRRLKPSFSGTFNKEKETIDGFTVENINSHFFRYIINTSRVHWRRELEDRATGNEKEDKKYFDENHFTILGSRLTEEEKIEQLLNLISKIFTLGYLLHAYKSPSRAWTVWAMETRERRNNEPVRVDESAGGTGKSFALRIFAELGIKRSAYLNGRDKELTKRQFALSKVRKDTDLIIVDDCDKNVKFDFFYSIITGETETNEKHEKSELLSFSQSPKLSFTSNFPPPKYDSSDARRFQFMIFSDWYHKKTEKNHYLETRKISDDFGNDIITHPLYKDEWKNEDINFLLDCLQFYLDCSEKGAKIDPPLKNVFVRMNEADMGDDFYEWADFYFSEDNGKANTFIPINIAYHNFLLQSEVNEKNWNSKRFNKALKAFCENMGYELNPPEFCNQKGHIIKWYEGVSTRMLYVKTI